MNRIVNNFGTNPINGGKPQNKENEFIKTINIVLVF